MPDRVVADALAKLSSTAGLSMTCTIRKQDKSFSSQKLEEVQNPQSVLHEVKTTQESSFLRLVKRKNWRSRLCKCKPKSKRSKRQTLCSQQIKPTKSWPRKNKQPLIKFSNGLILTMIARLVHRTLTSQILTQTYSKSWVPYLLKWWNLVSHLTKKNSLMHL